MQIKYIINDVNPKEAITNIGQLKNMTGEWYTKESLVRIQTSFSNAIVTSVIIKNYNADQVNVILKNGNLEKYYESVIDRNNQDWSKYQDRELQISNNEIYDELILEVINFDQKEFKGLQQLRIFGLQDEKVVEQQIQKKKPKKNNEETKGKKEKKQKKEKQQEPKPQQNQWQSYFKEPQQIMIEKKSNFKDARSNLRNLNRSPSPINEEVQLPQLERLGKEINDHEMLRYNLKDIDPQFLTLHTQCILYNKQVQITCDTLTNQQLNHTNLQRYWLI